VATVRVSLGGRRLCNHSPPNGHSVTAVDSSDSALTTAVQGGDEGAFRVLYQRHTPAMYAVALRMLARKIPEAEDAVQEAWLRAVRGLRAFRGDSTLRTWLIGITIRCALELIRRRRPEEEVMAERVMTSSPVVAIDLESAISQLPPGYRAVLILHDVEGYTHAEIGTLLGIEEGTSKSQLSRARQHVRRHLSAPRSGERHGT
jgi:RNA polymerase sigma-70 factor, ECF subfamily